MQISLEVNTLAQYVKRQLENNFPDGGDLFDLQKAIPSALERLEICFSGSNYALNWKDGECFFNHLNSDQYVVFIYFLSNVAFEEFENIELASKLFYLNKSLHSFHCMYDTRLPDVFLVLHGVGVVLGKAKYENYFAVTQNCTVGSNSDGIQPQIGESVIMYPGSSIIGRSVVKENTCIANGSFVNDECIERDSLVIGKSPNLIIKNNRKNRLNHMFKNGEIF